VDIEHVQVHPTGSVSGVRIKYKGKTKFLAPESVRAVGAILVDQNGNRFVC
jgi:aspartate oxidase